ncbi:hypothetical protein BH23BAC1_BH23BAC1_28560 [soil metagenome]
MNKTEKIIWQDLTVENAEEVRDFYSQVVGWNFSEHPMKEYSDYNMLNPSDGEVVAGICHKKGGNINLPSQWLNYVAVEDIEASLEKCTAMGGNIVEAPRQVGKSKFAVIQDPAGAYLALWQE